MFPAKLHQVEEPQLHYHAQTVGCVRIRAHEDKAWHSCPENEAYWLHHVAAHWTLAQLVHLGFSILESQAWMQLRLLGDLSSSFGGLSPIICCWIRLWGTDKNETRIYTSQGKTQRDENPGSGEVKCKRVYHTSLAPSFNWPGTETTNPKNQNNQPDNPHHRGQAEEEGSAGATRS